MSTASPPSALEALVRRDRLVVLSGLAVVISLAWTYMIVLASDMSSMMIPLDQAWTMWDFTFQFTMWAVMMVAMMTPSAAPMILTFSAVQRKRRDQLQPYVPTSVFVSGYIMAWTAFAIVATSAQWALHSAALLSPMMQSTSAVLGGIILLAVAVFQVTPIKYACLSNCRSPLSFIMTEWREGSSGALRMGIKHGGYCVGCCWALMSLLFVTGVMSLVWVALIAAFVLLEKMAPAGRPVALISVPVLVALSAATFAGFTG